MPPKNVVSALTYQLKNQHRWMRNASRPKVYVSSNIKSTPSTSDTRNTSTLPISGASAPPRKKAPTAATGSTFVITLNAFFPKMFARR